MFPILYRLFRQQFNEHVAGMRPVMASHGICDMLGLYVDALPNLQPLIDKAQAFAAKYGNRNDLTHEEYEQEVDEINALLNEFYRFENEYQFGREGL